MMEEKKATLASLTPDVDPAFESKCPVCKDEKVTRSCGMRDRNCYSPRMCSNGHIWWGGTGEVLDMDAATAKGRGPHDEAKFFGPEGHKHWLAVQKDREYMQAEKDAREAEIVIERTKKIRSAYNKRLKKLLWRSKLRRHNLAALEKNGC